MKALLEELLKIEDIDALGLFFYKDDPSLSSIFTVQNGSIKKSYEVSRKYLELLHSKAVQTVSIDTNRETLPLIRHCAAFRTTMEEQERPLSELYAMVAEYAKMNAVSGRKRGLHILEDLFSMQKNFVTGEYELVLEYGGELTPEAVKKLSQAVPPVRKVHYCEQEGGVLTFFPGSAPRPVDEAMLERLFEATGLARIHTDSIERALSLYREVRPRVVLIDDVTRKVDSKALLMELEKIDPFVKLLDWDPEQTNNIDWYAEQLEGLYRSSYANALAEYDFLKERKDPLPEDTNKKLSLLIKKLGEQYSYPLYIDIAFQLRKLARQFTVTFHRQMLENVYTRYKNQ